MLAVPVDKREERKKTSPGVFVREHEKDKGGRRNKQNTPLF
jgi:hypothetical protein